MAMSKFTVDTTNKLFICKSGVVDFDVQRDLYSEAKEEWQLGGVEMGFDFPIRSIGGDPVTAAKDAGATFFMLGGWQIRPDEANHTLRVTGNLFTDPFGTDPFVNTVGAYNVRVEYFVSNLIDAQTVSATMTQVQSLLEADQVYDEGSGLLHYYERGTTTDLIPAKTIAGTTQDGNASATE